MYAVFRKTSRTVTRLHRRPFLVRTFWAFSAAETERTLPPGPR